MPVGTDDFVFDFDGALALVQRLRDLAEAAEAAYSERTGLVGLLAQGWRGPAGDVFRDGMASEQRLAALAFAALREEAQGWLAAWSLAVNTMNQLALAGDQTGDGHHGSASSAGSSGAGGTTSGAGTPVSGAAPGGSGAAGLAPAVGGGIR